MALMRNNKKKGKHLLESQRDRSKNRLLVFFVDEFASGIIFTVNLAIYEKKRERK